VNSRITEYLPTSWFRRSRDQGAGDSSLEWNLKALAEPVEQFVAKHPGASLAVAFAAGVVIAWWLKRR
jgi:hypothetical protein